MKIQEAHVVGGFVGMVLAGVIQFGVYSATYGRTAEKVDTLEKRVSTLEDGGTSKVRVGDLCMKLMDAQIMAFRTGDQEGQEGVEGQMKDLGCYDKVEAAIDVADKPENVTHKVKKPDED